ncbi:hypothetical protein DL98DRAFT_655909 [Cadophora sp. DSE1049]|nr:hypothetical protein DL98DRAFT_655909 [Cadophora sp. DSE1049]
MSNTRTYGALASGNVLDREGDEPRPESRISLHPENALPQPISSCTSSSDVATTAGYVLSDPRALNSLPDIVRKKFLSVLAPVYATTVQVIKNSISSTHSSLGTSKKPICYFLGRLPPEIRLQIYRLLLVNPMLADTSSITEDDCNGAYTNYDLHPQILTTCRQIQQEACEVLYGENIFIMVCLDPVVLFHRPTRGPIQRSPITRYTTETQRFPSSTLLSPALLSKVRKWIIVTRTRGMSGRESMSVLDFCRSISRQPPRSLELCIADFNEINITPWGGPQLTDILKHFETLRNVGHFTVRDANRWETPMELLFLGLTFVRLSCGVLVQYGRAPVQIRAQFERYEIFSENICGGKLARLFDRRICRKFTNSGLDLEDLLKSHPLETAMKAASKFTTYHEPWTFKKRREEILQYLEPQYQRICATFTALSEHIKEAKKPGGFLSLKAGHRVIEYTNVEAALGITLLKEYFDALQKRDSHDPRFQVARVTVARFYAELPAEAALRQIEKISRDKKWHGFTPLFKAAVDDLDKQYLRI